jgi:hypothetical protein
MALMLSSLYDALLDAGASEDKARKAAEEAALYETRFAAMTEKLTALDGRVHRIEWMLGTNLVISLGALWKLITM